VGSTTRSGQGAQQIKPQQNSNTLIMVNLGTEPPGLIKVRLLNINKEMLSVKMVLRNMLQNGSRTPASTMQELFY
jgi:hypothetical protein